MKIKPPNFKSEKLPDFSVKLGESSSFKNELKSIAKKLAVDAPKSISSIDKPVVLDEHNLSISITKSPEIKKHSIIKEQTVKKGEIDDLRIYKI